MTATQLNHHVFVEAPGFGIACQRCGNRKTLANQNANCEGRPLPLPVRQMEYDPLEAV